MSGKKILGALIALMFLGVAAGAVILIVISSNLPKLITVEDYEPLLVSEVYDRKGEKIGEFYREKRILVPYDQIPEVLTQAFVSAEDSSFFEHSGINYVSIFRAFLANLKAGRKVQGGSTITMQVARSLLLSREKTYIRKIKEVMLSYRMEQNLSKQDILFLYLNQIYLGQGAYGVAAASEIYFRKPIQEITLAEAALLAGLPQAPSRYSPVYNPKKAKDRQVYVLSRMQEEKYISPEQEAQAREQALTVYVRKNYTEIAPFYLETIRQMLVKDLGESRVLDQGIQVYTGLDLEKQTAARDFVRQGLHDLDKRQGYRGPLKHLEEPKEIANFLLTVRNDLMDEASPQRVIQPDGSLREKGPLNLTGKNEKGEPLPNLPNYVHPGDMIQGVVTQVDDKWGLVTVRFAESKGLIDFETMEWARAVNPKVRWDFDKIKKPSEALKKGDVILARVVHKNFSSSRIYKMLLELKKKQKKKYERPADLPEFTQYASLELEQEPIAEASLISFDQKTGEIVAMVGGYDFARSKFNRSIQATRQTGSAFKSVVYASALDKGYTPATPIVDAPVVFEEEQENPEAMEANEEDEVHMKKWRPMNHSQRFIGDILFRNALIKSLNVPAVKIIEKLGVPWVADYTRRLGVFSPLNMDFTLALGSSGVTLYEMTKVFSQIGRLGRRIRPSLIKKVVDQNGQTLMETVSLDERFKTEIEELDESFEERRLAYLEYKKTHPDEAPRKEASLENVGDPSAPHRQNASEQEASESNKPIEEKTAQTETEETHPKPRRDPSKEPPLFFENPDQLIKPTTAYVTTSLLKAVIEEKGGTGGAARALGRPVAGKTGTTNGYYDAWFIGFTPDLATGVWVGFDEEKTLGRGEVGGRAALPIWLEYMKEAHKDLPIRNFPVPEGIVFANIDNESGRLASAQTKEVVRQAFIEGTEPSELANEPNPEDEKNFYKEDLTE